MRPALAIAVALSSALAASANEPCSSCSSCSSSVPRSAAAKPKIAHSLHSTKRYYGPVISPSAPYGYFPTNWRPWDGGVSFGGCATPIVIDQSAPATPVLPSNPAPMPNAKPETPGKGKTAGPVGPRGNAYSSLSNLR
jgi:hypothetical protein